MKQPKKVIIVLAIISAFGFGSSQAVEAWHAETMAEGLTIAADKDCFVIVDFTMDG